jgi:DNA repair photolyase
LHIATKSVIYYSMLYIITLPNLLSETHMTQLLKGRAATDNPHNRYSQHQREDYDDGWDIEETAQPAPATRVEFWPAKSIISRNQSPDIPFSQSINPYQGCEHGCIYCYARPSHAYWGYSPGLDFETRLIAKPNAAALLREELAKPAYRPSVICLGSNTDPYQPIERQQQLTRSILQVMLETRHPLTIISKNALIERDLDLLQPLAEKKLVQVLISLTSLDNTLSRRLEPRASSPGRRLQAIRKLSDAGIPVGVLTAPLIPALNDQYLEQMLTLAHEHGAISASYVLLRLPQEVAGLFEQWLQTCYPERAEHVLSLVRQSRQGQLNQSGFGQRMRGEGEFARMIAQRFRLAYQRLGFRQMRMDDLDFSQFCRPPASGQLTLF